MGHDRLKRITADAGIVVTRSGMHVQVLGINESENQRHEAVVQAIIHAHA